MKDALKPIRSTTASLWSGRGKTLSAFPPILQDGLTCRAWLAMVVLATTVGVIWPARADSPVAIPLQPGPIDMHIAKAVLAAAEQDATARRAPSSIAVADPSGDLVLFEQMDGARPSGINQAIEKARTAARYRLPTEALEARINGGRTAAITSGYVQMRGGVPIVVGGKIAGAIGVSGVDNANDVQIAATGAAAVK